jgi:hypothetical protein
MGLNWRRLLRFALTGIVAIWAGWACVYWLGPIPSKYELVKYITFMIGAGLGGFQAWWFSAALE